MCGRLKFAIAGLVGLIAIVAARAQVSVPAPTSQGVEDSTALDRVIGEVTATDPAAKQITIKLDAGGTVVVMFQETTVYLRVPPGEKDLKKAVKIAVSDIGIGDRVYARGRIADDHKSMPALAVIVMTRADLVKTRDRERADWQKRGVAGTISALNAETSEITLAVRSKEGTKTLIVEPSQKAVFRRYAPDSVRFVQAESSAFAELKVGDSLRILGDMNADRTRIKPEEIVSGSFRNIAGIVNAIDAAAGEIRITDLQTKKRLVVRVAPDSLLRRMPPPPKAAPAAGTQDGARRAPSEEKPGDGARSAPPTSTAKPQTGGKEAASGDKSGDQPSRRAPPGPTPDATKGGGSAASAKPPTENSQGAAAAPRSTRTDGPGGGQLDLEKMPALKFDTLKRGEAILVLCTVGAEPSRVTAIVLVAGVEPLLTSADGQTQIGGLWNFFDVSLP